MFRNITFYILKYTLRTVNIEFNQIIKPRILSTSLKWGVCVWIGLILHFLCSIEVLLNIVVTLGDKIITAKISVDWTKVQDLTNSLKVQRFYVATDVMMWESSKHSCIFSYLFRTLSENTFLPI